MEDDVAAHAPQRPSGSGLAGALWRATLGLLSVSALLILGAVACLVAGSRDWGIAVLFGYGWLAGALAMLAWSASLVLAAFGRGTLPRLVLALGGVLCVLASVLAALSLRSTGERTIVATVLVATLGGAVAAVVTWRRKPETSPSPP